MKRLIVALLVAGILLAPPAFGQILDLKGSPDKRGVGKASIGPRTKAHLEIQDKEVIIVTIPDEPDLPEGTIYIYEDDQFYIDVPETAQALLIEMAAEYLDRDFDIFVRYEQPVHVVDETTIEVDFWSMNPFGWEEMLIQGNDLLPGRYYICLGTASKQGGDLSLRAAIDETIVDLDPDAEILTMVSPDDDVAGNKLVMPDAQQFRLSVPQDAESIYVRYESFSLGLDTVLAARYGEPCVFTDQGLVYDAIVDAAGGYEELCFRGSPVLPGEDLYIWILNDSGGAAVIGTLFAAFDGCDLPLASGQTVEAIAMGYKEEGFVFLGSRQYVVTVGDPPRDMTLIVEPTSDPADLDIYVRKDLPVDISDESEILADFRAEEIGTGPETLRISCRDLAPALYYVRIGNAETRTVPYKLTLSETPCEEFIRGHTNLGLNMNIADAVMILTFLFAQGSQPQCMDAADSNDDGSVNIADAVMILTFLFAQGAPPPAPFGKCGGDPTDDKLACSCFPPCGRPCE